MTSTPISASEPQKPASPVQTPQQSQSDNKPNTDKPVGQPQQK
jgi:hypothetical protein